MMVNIGAALTDEYQPSGPPCSEDHGDRPFIREADLRRCRRDPEDAARAVPEPRWRPSPGVGA